MPKPTVYLDSTIPSVYHDQRTDPERVRWRRITRAWWEQADMHYRLVSATTLRDEVARGEPARAQLRLDLIRSVPLLAVSPQIRAVEEFYMEHKLMPRKLDADALHLAAASLHGCAFLLSWNFHHLANPNKTVHLRTLNLRLGLRVPRICTPEHLMWRSHDQL